MGQKGKRNFFTKSPSRYGNPERKDTERKGQQLLAEEAAGLVKVLGSRAGSRRSPKLNRPEKPSPLQPVKKGNEESDDAKEVIQMSGITVENVQRTPNWA